MSTRRHGWTMSLLLAIALLPAGLHAADITSVILCREVQEPGLVPIDIQETFPTTAPAIHAVVAVADVTGAMRIGAAWVAVNAIATPNYRIDATELEVAPGRGTQAHFTISKPDNDWPPGDYRLEVFLDGQLATIKTFTIVTAADRPAPGASVPPPAPGATAPGASDRGYGGTYQYEVQGTRVTLVLVEDPQGGLTGTLSSTSGMAFQLEGQVEGGAAVGICYDQEGATYFEAYAEGDDLWFSLIELDADNMPDYDRSQELSFTRVAGGERPTPRRSPSPPAVGGTGTGAGPRAPAAAAGVSRSGRAGRIYKHPVGFSFWYPDTWQAVMQEGFLQLIPPDAGSSPDGPTEIYGVVGEPVAGEGIFSPEDPRVVQYLDEQVRSISPYLQRKGGAVKMAMGQGEGAELNWEGTSPRGDRVRARSFVSIIKQHGVALIGLGFTDLLESRDADLRQMFSSFGFQEGQRDPAVVGRWQLVSTRAITNQSPWESDWSRAQAVSETSSILTFQPDGSWSRTDESHMIVGAGDVWLEDKDRSTSQGSWNAGDGLLYMVWEDGSYRECLFRVEATAAGRQLRLVCGDTGEVWETVR